MSATDPARLARHEAAGLLSSAAAGHGEVLGALDGHPLLVVDLDTPGPAPLDVPPGLPAVIVGVSDRPGTDAGGVDVALTGCADPPAPWVQADDREVAVAQLADRVAAAPAAAVTLVHVLRVGAALSLPEALLLESLAYSTLQGGPEHRAWLAARPARPPLPPAAGDAVEVGRDGGAVTVTLARPQRHNAFSAELRDALAQALAFVAADPTATALHLRGAGPSFCSGGDLAEFGTTPDPASAHLVRGARSCARLIAALHVPVTAHLHGHCIGAGIELAAAAGTVLAAADTRIALPEVGMGLIPGAGGTATLPRRIGAARTAWLALTGTTVDAAAAAAWGLVDGLR